MRRAAATPHGAAAAVEQQQLHAMPLTDFDQRLLGAVLCPGRCQRAGVLGRVGVADHHLLRPGLARAVAGHAQQVIDRAPGVLQIAQRLEQRHHAQRPLQAGFLEQQLDRQHIARCAGHGNHIGAQRRGRRLRRHPAGGQHLGGIRRRPIVPRQQRPRVVQLALEEVEALRLVPLGVAADT
ncbi:hypothetical protein D3C78_1379980 [compost metagenome]